MPAIIDSAPDCIIHISGAKPADDSADFILQAAYAKCQGVVWNTTQTGKRGRVQKLLEGDKLVLVRGKVFRDNQRHTYQWKLLPF